MSASFADALFPKVRQRVLAARLDAGRDTRIAISPPEAADWTGRAKALERDLIARWSAD